MYHIAFLWFFVLTMGIWGLHLKNVGTVPVSVFTPQDRSLALPVLPMIWKRSRIRITSGIGGAERLDEERVGIITTNCCNKDSRSIWFLSEKSPCHLLFTSHVFRPLCKGVFTDTALVCFL